MTSHDRRFQQFLPTAANSLIGLPDPGHVGLMFDEAESLIRLNDDGTTTPIAGSARYNAITVAPEGADFTSVKDALDSITTNSVTNRFVVEVSPGIYSEDNPIQGKEYVIVKSRGDNNTTRLQANNPNADFFIGAHAFILRDFTIADVTGTGYAVNMSVPGSMKLQDLIFFECANGLYQNNVNSVVGMLNTIITLPSVTMTYGARILNGNFIGDSIFVISPSAVGTIVSLEGSGVLATLYDILTFSPGVVTGIFCDDSSRTVVYNASLAFMTDGIVLSDGADLRLNGANIFLAQQDAVRIDNVGSGTNLGLYSFITESNIRYDLNILSPTAVVTGFGSVYIDQLNVVSGAQIIMGFVDLKEGDEGWNNLGQFSVGRAEQGYETVLGQGDSYTRGLVAYTYNPAGAVWTEISDEVKSASGSTFTFPDVAPDNAILICSTLHNSDYLQHFGIKISQTVAAILGGGSIVVERFNGATWDIIHHMSTDADEPFDQYAEDIFERTGSEQLRYEKAMLSGWTKNDPMSLGTDYFWVRFRVASAITTEPVFQQFKLSPSKWEANEEGGTERFGAGRYPIDSLVHIALNDPVLGSTPANEAVAFSATITLTLTRNKFRNNSVDAFGMEITIPVGLDTSIPIELETIWYPDTNNAGDIELEVYASQHEIGGLWDGSVSEVSTSEVEVVPINDQFVTRKTTFEIDVSQLIPGELLVYKVQRDATVPNDPPDTLAGDIVFGSVRAFGHYWRP